MQVLRVQPRLWEKPVLLWKLLLEALQVDRQSVLPRYVVHAKKVIHALIGLELGEDIGCDAKILPADLPIQIFGIGRQEALQLLQQFFILHG